MHEREYIIFIENEFKARVRKNPSYSLRAFARALEMQPSKLSEVLRGICGISPKAARRIAKAIQLTRDETEYFVSLVEAKHSRSKLSRAAAEEKVEAILASSNYDELALERFKIISDWYHYAILELTDLHYYESSPEWIAGRLGITTVEARDAIERLIDFGLLNRSKNGKITQTQTFLATPTGIPSRELRNHHSQILVKADSALQSVPIEERDFSAITMSIDSRDLEAAKKEFKEFRRKFCADRQTSEFKDRVYCLGIQFFPLDQNFSKNKKESS